MMPDADLLDRLYAGRIGEQEEAELALFFLVNPDPTVEWWMTVRNVACRQCLHILCDHLVGVAHEAIVDALHRFAERLGLHGYDWSHVFDEIQNAPNTGRMALVLNQLVMNLGLQVAVGPLQHLRVNGPALMVLLLDELRPLRTKPDDVSDHVIAVVRRFTPELGSRG